MSRRFEEDFIPSIRNWCLLHPDKISKCYATMHKGYPSLFIFGSRAKRSREMLHKPLLDLKKNLQLRGWQAEVLAIPPEQAEHYDAFFTIEQAVLVFGQESALEPDACAGA
jgi:hypothetical protein